MPDRAERKDEKGLSARILILIFVMGVAACAVFFSLGFLVGYTERPSSAANAAEEIGPSGAVPPLVNPPLEPPQTAQVPLNPSGQGDLPTEHIALTPPTPSKPEPKPSAAALKAAAKSTTAKVTPTATQRKEPRAGFTVQVAASREKGDAEKLMKELRSRGFDVFVVPPKYSEAKDNLYRVQVGPYATREEAVRVRDRIAKEGFKSFIKQ